MQLAVSRGGSIFAEGAWGKAFGYYPAVPEDAPGTTYWDTPDAGPDMTTETIVPWASSTKVLTAVAVAQMWERGLLDLDDRVCRYVPEYAQKGKDDITIRHCLTHTTGIIDFPYEFWSSNSHEDVIAAICARELKPGWDRFLHASYGGSGLQILGEIVSRIDGRAYPTYVQEEVIDPLGMRDCWMSMPEEEHAGREARFVRRYTVPGGKVRYSDHVSPASFCAACDPGGGGRGPLREFIRVYQMLLAKGQGPDSRLLSPQTVEAVTARHRVGRLVDRFNTILDLGLILYVDSKQYSSGDQSAALFGEHVSPRAFGHGGGGGVGAFADPEYGLAICTYAPTPGLDDKRRGTSVEIATAVYEDLGLARG